MPLVTLGELVAVGIGPTQARSFVDPLNAILPSWDVTGRLRLAAFLAQTMHESARFTKLEENLNYRAARIAEIWPRLASRSVELAMNPKALANAAYSNKIGNGDEASGDGWNFRGRGLIQLTGRANYFAASKDSGKDFVANPDYLLTPDGAIASACWFWKKNDLNKFADASNIDAVTKRINPAMAGQYERKKLLEHALTVLA